MCKEATAAGAHLMLNRHAMRIEMDQEADGLVTVHCGTETGDHQSYEARQVLVTASLGVLRSDAIRFKPELPPASRRAIDSCRMAHYVKVFASWSHCWWQPIDADPLLDGHGSHTLLVGKTRGRWPLVTVVSEGDSGKDSVLCFTATGEEALRVEALPEDTEALAAELTTVLNAAFPEVCIPAPTRVMRTTWGTDPRYRGAYSFLPLGAMPEGWDPLLGSQWPDGRLWLAGEACHPLYSGYLHGALLSGCETAERMLVDAGIGNANKD